VAAANLHDAIVPARIGEAIDLLGSFRDQLRVPEFVYISHLRPLRGFHWDQAL